MLHIAEQLIVRPRRKFRFQKIADRIVLAHEQMMQHAQPLPPVVGERRMLNTRIRINSQQPIIADLQLPACKGPVARR